MSTEFSRGDYIRVTDTDHIGGVYSFYAIIFFVDVKSNILHFKYLSGDATNWCSALKARKLTVGEEMLLKLENA